MPIVSKLKYLRISPRKVRLVADLIRKKKVDQAERILNFTVKKAAEPIAKLLKTAIADARNNFHIDSDNLYISKITVDEGPKYKRWRPRARGTAYQINKRTCHITLVLEEDKQKKELQARESRKEAVQSGRLKKIVPSVKENKKEEASSRNVKIEKKTKVQKVSEKKSIDKVKKIRQHSEIESKFKPKGVVKGLRKVFRRKAI